MSESLRIVLDARATTPHFPGVSRATLGLLHGLHTIEHDHRINVLSYGDAPPASHPAFHDRRFRRVGTNAAALSIAQQWRLPLVARDLQPDLWHAPYYIRPFWSVPRPIVTVYDVIGHVVPQALPSLNAKLLFELTLRLSLRGAAHIITSSETTRRDLEAIYGIAPAAISVIPLAADASFHPRGNDELGELRSRYDIPRRYVLYIGSNKPHKNLVTLIHAWSRIQTDATLVIAGYWDRRYEQPKTIAAASSAATRIRFIHDLPNKAMPPLLSRALCFVFPSLYEGFGLPALEAMACGTPVIVSDAASLPEVVGDAGLIVPPTADAFAAAIETLLSDAALRDQLRRRGIVRARQFSWERTALETLAVYERIHQVGT